MASSLQTLVRTDKPPIVFVSYSHKDEAWKDKLLPQLKNLEKLGTVEVWNDRQIKAGVDWYHEIKDVLSRTKVAICLISSNFLSSSFCLDEEVAYLLQARNRGDLEIIPVLVEDCVWQPHRWLKRLQMFPRDGQSVTTHFKDNPAQIFSAVATQTYEMLQPGYAFERPPSPNKPPENIDIDRLPQTGELLFGRREELDALDGIWNGNTLNVAVFKASGGVGKSSLIRAWVEDMALDNYRGAERVFAWSFYSQGTKERVTSADEFISHALGWFGDETKGESKSPWDRGQHLADLVREKRTLLLLDGLEPLQSGQAFDRGKIKDPGLEVLLDELSRNNPGLCLISTREEVSDLWHEEEECQVGQFDLDTISITAGRALLRVSGIEGEDAALEQAVKDFGKHAYAVKLLGNFLTWCGTPHIEHAASIPDLPDVEENEGKHPRRVMAAFAERFGDSAKADILAMLGLFDRPADAGCIAALRAQPAVPGLNAAVLPVSKAVWDQTVDELRALGLLTPESHLAPHELDAHPLVREHFGAQLRDKSDEAWKLGHERLYEHLQGVQKKHQPDTLAEMAPLFLAVHHGCQAGCYDASIASVYDSRLRRGDQQAYQIRKLGAFGIDLGLLSGFFEDDDWRSPVQDLCQVNKLKVKAWVAYDLRNLGRFENALLASQSALIEAKQQSSWTDASWCAENMCAINLVLGRIDQALLFAEESIDHAERCKKTHERVARRTALAEVFHKRGKFDEALEHFRAAEGILSKERPDAPCLESLWSYRYCELLIEIGQKQKALDEARQSLECGCNDVNASLQHVGLSRLSLGQARMAIFDLDKAYSTIRKATDELRLANNIENVIRGLLSRAACLREMQEFDRSRRDLDETINIAKRCGMLLHKCDAHLEISRLEIKQGNPDAARVHVTSAEALVSACGYHRRDGEVAALKEELGL
ncbi:MAG: toll/interleukin-1 receptor domain-containing protein [Alphaproteobacteria bacterium]